MRDEYDFSKGIRGAVVPMPPEMRRVTIRLDKEVLEWFFDQCEKAGSGDYQTMINDALREHIRQKREPRRKRCGCGRNWGGRCSALYGRALRIHPLETNALGWQSFGAR